MKGVKIIFCLILILAFTWFNLSYSYDNAGYGARATGMGAFVGLADDPSAIFYNPAGIAQINLPQIYFMYDRITKNGFGELENPYLVSGAIVYPLNHNLRLIAGGSQKGSWADPTAIVTNNIGIVGLAGWLMPELSAGFNGKFLYNSNYGKKKGFDFDLGLFCRVSPKFSFGISMENVLAQEMIPEHPDTLRYAVRQGKIGLAYHFGWERYSTTLAWDLKVKNSVEPENKTYTLNSLGIEEWILTGSDLSLGVRGGYTFGKEYEKDLSQPGFGFSIRYKGVNQTFQLDYSFQKYPYKSDESIAGDHRVSFSVMFGGTGEKKKEKEEEVVQDFHRLEYVEISPIQQIPEPVKKPEEVKPLSTNQTFKLTSSVEQLSAGRNRSVMFMLKPELEEQIDQWRLYICSEKPEGFESAQLKPVLLKIIEGRGVLSSGIIWDCRYNGETLKKGTYYYALELVDQNGQLLYSQWNTFKLK
ncbi:MAG: hypothetical protein OEV55_02510 [candidate division Zixibacteria bacterium]|nr:hypothetical protein [candidate division Zixibacteria bacterium]